MNILHNSIWKTLKGATFTSGTFRVLYVEQVSDLVILYNISEQKHTAKPFAVTLTAFSKDVEEKHIVSSHFELPVDCSKPDSELPITWIDKRNENYALIKGIVEDICCLLDFAHNKRSKVIPKHIATFSEPKPKQLKIARLLSLYWTYGQSINALLPHYSKVGNRYQTKKVSNNKAGRKNQILVLNQLVTGKPFSEEDKKHALKVLKKYYLSRAQLPINECYDNFLVEYYAAEVSAANQENRPAVTPSLRQFKYWANSMFPINKLIVSRDGNSYYQGNVKQLSGSSAADTFGAGSIYQIDATTADVYLVNPNAVNEVIGRPTIYCVIDVYTRLIVGIYIGMKHPSWAAARIALWYTFNKKEDLCRRFGINCSDEQWPSFHLPDKIVVDRGELIGHKPEQSLPFMGTTICVTSPYRGDMKAIVEKRFDIFNDDIHTLDGTTKGKPRRRDERNPCLSANLTLEEFCQIILMDVIHHNLHTTFDDLCTDELYRNDIDPTPINVWQYCVENHCHELTEVSPQQLYAGLLDQQLKFHLTRYGIEIHKRRYTSAEFREYIDEHGGKLPPKSAVRKNPDDTNYIYFRVDEHSPFMRLELAQSRRHFGDKSESEVVDMQHWIEGKKREPAKLESRLNKNKNKTDIITAARERSADAGKVTNAEKIRNIRDNRKNADELLSFSMKDDTIEEPDLDVIDGSTDDNLDLFSQEIDDLWDED